MTRGPWIRRVLLVWFIAMAGAAGLACRGRSERLAALSAQRMTLQREVQGLRELAAARERGEPMVPADDVAIAIDEGLVRDLISAQLPLQLEVERFQVTLTEAEVRFRGSPLVRLRGSGFLRGNPRVSAAVNALGALEQIEVDRASGTLRSRIAVDQIGIEKAAGLESVLHAAALDQLADALRRELQSQLPVVEIPVRVQQSIDLPALTSGPVRVEGARLPLEVAVSRVFAGQGRLWIGVSVHPGRVVRTGR